MFEKFLSPASRPPLKRFTTETSGAIAIMAGLLFPIMVFTAGGATDVSRVMNAKAKSQRALDSTVLSLARSGLSAAEIEQKGPDMLRGNLAGRNIAVDLISADFKGNEDTDGDGKPDSVSAEVRISTKAFFLSALGKKTLDATISTSAMKPGIVPFEIAMVLDVSGSMNIDLSGKPRIERLKQSSVALFDTLEGALARKAEISVAVVPYSTSVNLGNLDNTILEGTSLTGLSAPPVGLDVWAAERVRGAKASGFDINDDSPYARQIPFMTATDISNATPKSRMQPLSTERSVYQKSVDDLTAQGLTAAHLGMIWGLYALSPNWNAAWPTDAKPYGAANKVIILLSDGDFNTTHAIGKGSSRDGKNSNAYFQSACDLAKAKGITIYAVALSLQPASEKRLEKCTAGGGGMVFKANSADSLKDAFVKIAKTIGRLRITS